MSNFNFVYLLFTVLYPTSRGYSLALAFSVYEVIRVPFLPRSWLQATYLHST